MEQADIATPATAAQETARLQVSKIIRNWQARQQANPFRRYAWRLSPVAAAAIVLLVFVWQSHTVSPVVPPSTSTGIAATDAEQAAAHLQRSLESVSPNEAEVQLVALADNIAEKPSSLSESLWRQ